VSSSEPLPLGIVGAFPEKPLADIGGVTWLSASTGARQRQGRVGGVLVATTSGRIAEAVARFRRRRA